MIDSPVLVKSARKATKKKLPKGGIRSSSAFEIKRMSNDRIAIHNRQLISMDKVKPTDILSGRGGGKSHDEGHQAYLDLKDKYHKEYRGHGTHEEKQQCVDTVISTLERSGRRFLTRIEGMRFCRFMTTEEIRRKVQQALREPRKAKVALMTPHKPKQRKRPLMVDVTNPDEPGVAHAVDTVLNKVSDYKSIGSELEMDVLRGDHNHFNRIFADFYQDENEVEGSMNENDSYTMKHVTYANFFDDMDAIGNWSLLELQKFQADDASAVLDSVPSKFGDNCDMYAI